MIEPDTDDDPNAEQHVVTKYDYTGIGLVENEIHTSLAGPNANSLTYGDEIKTHYVYDDRHRLNQESKTTSSVLRIRIQKTLRPSISMTRLEISSKSKTHWATRRITITTRWIGSVGITEEDPDGPSGSATSPVTQMAYDGLGRLITQIDSRGNVTRYEYDKRHRLTKASAPLGAAALRL